MEVGLKSVSSVLMFLAGDYMSVGGGWGRRLLAKKICIRLSPCEICLCPGAATK